MKQTTFVGTNTMLESAKSLVREGVLSQEQYAMMERRNERLCAETRNNIVILHDSEE